jgi:hypothetical protein
LRHVNKVPGFAVIIRPVQAKLGRAEDASFAEGVEDDQIVRVVSA